MCTTSETCRANSVIKTALNNLHHAGPNKTLLILPLRKIFYIRDISRFILILFLLLLKVTVLVAAFFLITETHDI